MPAAVLAVTAGALDTRKPVVSCFAATAGAEPTGRTRDSCPGCRLARAAQLEFAKTAVQLWRLELGRQMVRGGAGTPHASGLVAKSGPTTLHPASPSPPCTAAGSLLQCTVSLRPARLTAALAALVLLVQAFVPGLHALQHRLQAAADAANPPSPPRRTPTQLRMAASPSRMIRSINCG
jgi:hypothetical protein